MIMETIKNKIKEWKDRRYSKGLARFELIIDYEQFKNAMIKTGKALSKFGWCFCPRCGAYSNYDFSFCPTCACPKKSRLVKIKEKG